MQRLAPPDVQEDGHCPEQGVGRIWRQRIHHLDFIALCRETQGSIDVCLYVVPVRMPPSCVASVEVDDGLLWFRPQGNILLREKVREKVTRYQKANCRFCYLAVVIMIEQMRRMCSRNEPFARARPEPCESRLEPCDGPPRASAAGCTLTRRARKHQGPS